jgi:hypothetical protein
MGNQATGYGRRIQRLWKRLSDWRALEVATQTRGWEARVLSRTHISLFLYGFYDDPGIKKFAIERGYQKVMLW